MQCGRRMFLSALILAAKYLQDKNYSTSAWEKITGLDAPEINRNERVFLTAIDYRLHITKETFQSWTQLVLDVCNHTQHSPPLNPCDMVRTKQCRQDWNRFVRTLNPPAIAQKASVNEDLKVLLQHDFSISVYEVPTDFFQSPRTPKHSALDSEDAVEMHQMLRPARTSPQYPQPAQQTPRAIPTCPPHSRFQYGLPTPPQRTPSTPGNDYQAGLPIRTIKGCTLSRTKPAANLENLPGPLPIQSTESYHHGHHGEVKLSSKPTPPPEQPPIAEITYPWNSKEIDVATALLSIRRGTSGNQTSGLGVYSTSRSDVVSEEQMRVKPYHYKEHPKSNFSPHHRLTLSNVGNWSGTVDAAAISVEELSSIVEPKKDMSMKRKNSDVSSKTSKRRCAAHQANAELRATVAALLWKPEGTSANIVPDSRPVRGPSAAVRDVGRALQKDCRVLGAFTKNPELPCIGLEGRQSQRGSVPSDASFWSSVPTPELLGLSSSKDQNISLVNGSIKGLSMVMEPASIPQEAQHKSLTPAADAKLHLLDLYPITPSAWASPRPLHRMSPLRQMVAV